MFSLKKKMLASPGFDDTGSYLGTIYFVECQMSRTVCLHSVCCLVIAYKENLRGFSWSALCSASGLLFDSCRQHMRLLLNDTPAQRMGMCVNMCVCVFALQVHWLQPAEILVFPWMAVATGKVGSLATLWPFPVIQVMNCKGRAESPASKWKIDTTGSPALRAV